MKKRSAFYSAAVGIVSAGLMLQFGAGDTGALAQRSETPASLVTKTSKVSGPNASAADTKKSVNTAFLRASVENKRTSGTLRWPFGGRTQNGWKLYSLLIAETVGTDASFDSPEFAESLAAWQRQHSLTSTGIVDTLTMQAFVKFWQSERLGRSVYPGDDKLILAPSIEFWDNSRPEELRRLERGTYQAYKKMIAAAAKDLGKDLKLTAAGELAADEKFLRIVSAYRSREYQAQLRKNQPGAGRAALAKHSPHFTGQALDIYVGGEPVTTKDANRAIQVETPAYKWLVKNARKFGFVPYFYEPWHWEYIGQSK